MHDQTREFSNQKDKIRQAALSRRRSLDAAETEKASAGIRLRLDALEVLSSCGCVHAFWPIHEKHEVDLRPLLRRWVNEGRTVVLPVVRMSGPGRLPYLEHRKFTLEDHLVVSEWGIAEPVTGDKVDVQDIDAVLVPALSVDPRGIRIGYGKGFYDRFLQDVDAVRICPVYDADVLQRIPPEEHDEPVDIVVTERRTLIVRRT